MNLVQHLQLRAARRLISLPPHVITRVAGPAPSYRGVTLDHQVWLALALARLTRRPTLDSLPPAEARREQRVLAGVFDIEPLPVRSVVDQTIAGVPVRIYRDAPGEQPVLIFLHGGGFVIGDLDGYDASCRYLAVRARTAVISVDYRLAPEHRFPAAVDDVVAVLQAVTRDGSLGFDRARVAIGGDSAGGNLAAVAAQLGRDGGFAPRFQLLIYPLTDARGGTQSRRDLRRGYVLTSELMDYFHRHYASPSDDPRISPVLGRLEGLCPAYIATAGFDPLRDEAEEYARRLAAAGVPVTHRCFGSLIHGATSMAGFVPAARELLDALVAALVHGLGG